jgi:signal transduction histidine kinase/response regulator RpfG family c-di-GMP phosphodiesterase
VKNADWLILNIDDQQAIRYAKSRALQRAGFNVMEATCGTEGLECVEKYRPALVLCDVKMPDMNGLEVCRIIKERFPGTMVLQVSASFVTARDRAAGLDRGADSYLTEPVEPEELVASVRALLRLKESENELRTANARRECIFNLVERLRATENDADIMQCAADALGEKLAAARTGFCDFTPDGNLRVLAKWESGELLPLAEELSINRIGERLAAEYLAGRTIVASDARDVAPANGESYSVIGMPLLRGRQWHSTLYIHAALGREWSVDEVTLAEEVGKLAWDAVLRARANQELRALNATLEEKIAERTRELMGAEAQLRQSQKMEAVGQLTGGLAHDFNNLLTGIIGGIEVVRRRIQRGDTRDLDPIMDEVVKSAHGAASLIQRLLAFSRQQSLDMKPVDINEMIASLDSLLRRSVDENIELQFRIDPSAGSAATDANQLETAILNLVINARDAMPDGGTITIAANTHEFSASEAPQGVSPGAYVCLSVSDNGTGMPQDVIDKAFDPFFTTKPVGQGTGLGLSMIYGFVKQARGHVEIESEVGKGTSVRIYLPRSVPQANPADSDRARELSSGSGETVLVAEDNSGVRTVISDLLREMKFDPIMVADGAEAVEVIKRGQKIDLLITDVGLPGMNGRQVAEIARRVWPHVRVLFITGYAEAAKHRAEFLIPGAELMAKPFQMEALATKIHEMINRPAV